LRVTAVALALLIVAAVAAMPHASATPACGIAQDITVDTTADVVDSGDGQRSLREAVEAANSDGSPTTIHLEAGTYVLTEGLTLETDCQLTIVGVGARATTLRETGPERVIDNTNANPVILRALSITGGRVPGDGGGIRSGESQLNLDRVTIRGNTARDSGGGIANSGTLTVTASTISANTASPASNPSVSFGRGGGISNTGAGTLTLTDSTVSGNHAGSGSGGDGMGGGVGNTATLHLASSTLANNSASGAGGNVSDSGSADRVNSLFVGGSPFNCSGPGLGSPSSGDQSMASDATCFGVVTPNLELGPLLDNGGPTNTHALLPGSAAIDGGESLCPDDPVFPVIDQRGITRPDGKCDVGAFEVVQGANLSLAMSAAPKPVAEHAASGLTFTIVVRSTGPAGDATQPVVTDVLPAGVTLLRKGATQGSCTGAHRVVCALGTLRNGAVATVSIRVRVDRNQGSLVNTASLASPRPDKTPADDHWTVTALVNPSDDDDTIGGTDGADRLCGLLGDDTIRGRGGPDKLFGDGCGRRKGPGGRDTLFGGGGDDTLAGGGGRNTLHGGRGNDRIEAVNGRKDSVDCGEGAKDVARVDPADTVEGCETVKRANS
jgi:uncharacterized repeat protein (TIGR01451 family)/CSLREA domain-containing protein